MEKYLVKIEEVKEDLPYYAEAKSTKPLNVMLSEACDIVDFQEDWEETRYRREKIKTLADEFIGLYVDDKSFEFINKMFSLANAHNKFALRKQTKRLEENFDRQLFSMRMSQNKIKEKIRNLPWYRRLFKQF